MSESGRQRNRALAILHGETRRVIKLRRSQLDEIANIANNMAEDEFGVKQRLAFLDSLLLAQRDGGHLTDQNIQEEVDTFMFEVFSSI